MAERNNLLLDLFCQNFAESNYWREALIFEVIDNNEVMTTATSQCLNYSNNHRKGTLLAINLFCAWSKNRLIDVQPGAVKPPDIRLTGKMQNHFSDCASDGRDVQRQVRLAPRPEIKYVTLAVLPGTKRA